jgi:hypothetical protein
MSKQINVKITFQLEFVRYKYEDTPKEPDLTIEEINEFMKEEYCGKPRYYWYASTMTNFIYQKNQDHTNFLSEMEYKDETAKLSFVVNINGKNVKSRVKDLIQNLHEFHEKAFVDSLFDGMPGNELIVPSRKSYTDSEIYESEESNESLDLEEDSYIRCLGYIDFEVVDCIII